MITPEQRSAIVGEIRRYASVLREQGASLTYASGPGTPDLDPLPTDETPAATALRLAAWVDSIADGFAAGTIRHVHVYRRMTSAYPPRSEMTVTAS